MVQNTESDIDDIDIEDDEWDDLDDDLEHFDTTSDSILNKNEKNLNKSKNIKNKHKSKKSSSALLFGLFSLIAVSGASWVALSSNPNILSLILSITSGEKNDLQPKVLLDQPQNANENQIQDDKTLVIQEPNLPNIPNLDDASNKTQTSLEKVQPLEVEKGEDEALTPMPDLEALKKVAPQIELSNLDEQVNNEVPIEVSNVPTKIADEPVVVEDTLDQQKSLDPQSIENIAKIPLEENKLQVQTDKSFEEIEVPLPSDEQSQVDNAKSETQEATLKDNSKVTPEAPNEVLLSSDKLHDTDNNKNIESDNHDLNINLEKVNSVKVTDEVAKIVKAEPIDNSSKETKNETIKSLNNTSKETNENPKPPQVSKQEPAISKEKPDPKTLKEISIKDDKLVSVQKVIPLPKWDLRSASIESALIFDKLSGNVLQIGIGSSVKGIGRVKTIEKRDGKWTVVGTTGVIQQ